MNISLESLLFVKCFSWESTKARFLYNKFREKSGGCVASDKEGSWTEIVTFLPWKRDRVKRGLGQGPLTSSWGLSHCFAVYLHLLFDWSLGRSSDLVWNWDILRNAPGWGEACSLYKMLCFHMQDFIFTLHNPVQIIKNSNHPLFCDC